MDVERFTREREDRWRRFALLLDRAETVPERELGPAGMRELLQLYRTTAADLNRARSLTANPEILERLNALAGRGYRFLYRARGTRGEGLLPRFSRFVLLDIPEAFQQEVWAVLVAVLALFGGALVGAGAILARPSAAPEIIPAGFFTESPRARVEKIEEGEERIRSVGDAALFGAQLYVNNIRVSFLAFGLGALTLVGGVWILFYNGVLLGAVATTYYLDGVSVFFLAWVGPHGSLELPAIALAGATGFAAGRAFFFPGDRSRGDSMRAAFPRLFRMLSGVVMTLVVAGWIEGSFSQFSAKTVPYGLKIGVAALLFLSLAFYLFYPRGPREPREPRTSRAPAPGGSR